MGHGVVRGHGPRIHVDLRVNVLHVVPTVLLEIPNCRAMLRLVSPRDSSTSTSISRSVRPAGSTLVLLRCPAACSTASTLRASSRPERASPRNCSAANESARQCYPGRSSTSMR